MTAARRALVAALLAVSVGALVATSTGSEGRRGPVAPHPVAASRPRCTTVARVARWPLWRRVAQVVVVPAEEGDISAVGPAVRQGAGGVILFGSAGPEDLGAELSALDAGAPAGLAPLVMADEEGGGVQRLANLVGSLPWPQVMAATMTPARVEALAERTARAMRANGVTMDLAPDLDLASGPGPDASHTDGPRSFSPEAPVATAYGLAFARGLEAGGVLPVVKHFPGEGSATANTDDAPASTPPLLELAAFDLKPFEQAIKAGLPAVMVGDASVPGLTAAPASLSPAVVGGLLRHTLGFKGLVVTDSLSAAGIAGLGITLPQAAAEALVAGDDLLLYDSAHPLSSFHLLVNRLKAAVVHGQLAPSVLDRADAAVLAAKGVDPCR